MLLVEVEADKLDKDMEEASGRGFWRWDLSRCWVFDRGDGDGEEEGCMFSIFSLSFVD